MSTVLRTSPETMAKLQIDTLQFMVADYEKAINVQTDLLYHLIEMCEVFQNNDGATDEDAYELSKAIIRTINSHLKEKTPVEPCGPDEKKPRLFYWEEGHDSFVPAPDLVENILDVEDLDVGEDREIKFKRFDLSDNEMAALPEC